MTLQPLINSGFHHTLKRCIAGIVQEENRNIFCSKCYSLVLRTKELRTDHFNAVKACNEGGTVKLTCTDNKVVISDNGKGMTEEQLLHITEPFYRTDRSRSRAEGGAGLGLALCKQIALSHNADISFSSRMGEGTEITVTFTT